MDDNIVLKPILNATLSLMSTVSVCFVVWWLTLCTINSIRNKCKTCVIFFHTLVFVRQNNAMSYNIFSFKLFLKPILNATLSLMSTVMFIVNDDVCY
jgi:hypothetical protein